MELIAILILLLLIGLFGIGGLILAVKAIAFVLVLIFVYALFVLSGESDFFLAMGITFTLAGLYVGLRYLFGNEKTRKEVREVFSEPRED